MQLLNISYNQETGQGWYVIRMEPGAASIPHTHESREEYLILEGDLIESDGTVLKSGDFVSYAPGTHHNSTTENGCLLPILWREDGHRTPGISSITASTMD